MLGAMAGTANRLNMCVLGKYRPRRYAHHMCSGSHMGIPVFLFIEYRIMYCYTLTACAVIHLYVATYSVEAIDDNDFHREWC